MKEGTSIALSRPCKGSETRAYSTHPCGFRQYFKGPEAGPFS